MSSVSSSWAAINPKRLDTSRLSRFVVRRFVPSAPQQRKSSNGNNSNNSSSPRRRFTGGDCEQQQQQQPNSNIVPGSAAASKPIHLRKQQSISQAQWEREMLFFRRQHNRLTREVAGDDYHAPLKLLDSIDLQQQQQMQIAAKMVDAEEHPEGDETINDDNDPWVRAIIKEREQELRLEQGHQQQEAAEAEALPTTPPQPAERDRPVPKTLSLLLARMDLIMRQASDVRRLYGPFPPLWVRRKAQQDQQQQDQQQQQHDKEPSTKDDDEEEDGNSFSSASALVVDEREALTNHGVATMGPFLTPTSRRLPRFLCFGPNLAARIFLAQLETNDAMTTTSNDNDSDDAQQQQQQQPSAISFPLQDRLFLLATRVSGIELTPVLRVTLFLWLCKSINGGSYSNGDSNNAMRFAGLRPGLVRGVLADAKACIAAVKELASSSSSMSESCSFDTSTRIWCDRFKFHPDIVRGYEGNLNSALALATPPLAETAEITMFPQWLAAMDINSNSNKFRETPALQLLREIIRLMGAAWCIPDLPATFSDALCEEASRMELDDALQLLEWVLMYGRRFTQPSHSHIDNSNSSSSSERNVTGAADPEARPSALETLDPQLHDNSNSKSTSGDNTSSADIVVNIQQVQLDSQVRLVAGLASALLPHVGASNGKNHSSATKRIIEVFEHSFSIMTLALRRDLMKQRPICLLVERTMNCLCETGVFTAEEAVQQHEKEEQHDKEQQQQTKVQNHVIELPFFVSCLSLANRMETPELGKVLIDRMVVALSRQQRQQEQQQQQTSSKMAVDCSADDDLLAALDGFAAPPLLSSSFASSAAAAARPRNTTPAEHISRFLSTSDVTLWANLVNVLNKIPGTLTSASSSPLVLDAVLANGMELVSREDDRQLKLRQLGAACRAVGAAFKRIDEQTTLSITNDPEDKQQHKQQRKMLEQFCHLIDNKLSDIVATANDMLLRRSRHTSRHLLFGGRRGDEWEKAATETSSGNSNNESDESSGTTPTFTEFEDERGERAAPPIPCADILYFLGGFEHWPQEYAAIVRISKIEALARDAIGNRYHTRITQVFAAMKAFTERVFDNSSSNDKDANDEEKEGTKTAKPPRNVLKTSDTMLIDLLAARLIPANSGNFSWRYYEPSDIVALARFLVAARFGGTVTKSSILAFEQLLLTNNTAQRLSLADLNEVAVIFVHVLRGPTDGEFVDSVVDRWRESAESFPDVATLSVATRLAMTVRGDAFSQSELAKQFLSKAEWFVERM